MVRERKSLLRRIVDSTVFSVALGISGLGVFYYSQPPKQEEGRPGAEPELRRYYKEREQNYGLLGAGLIYLAVLNAGRASISRQLREK